MSNTVLLMFLNMSNTVLLMFLTKKSIYRFFTLHFNASNLTVVLLSQPQLILTQFTIGLLFLTDGTSDNEWMIKTGLSVVWQEKEEAVYSTRRQSKVLHLAFIWCTMLMCLAIHKTLYNKWFSPIQPCPLRDFYDEMDALLSCFPRWLQHPA